MRLMTQSEVDSLGALSEVDVPFGLIEPTPNGLGHYLMDATSEFRDFLASSGVHNYSEQLKGESNKKKVPAFVLMPNNTFVSAEASLYRPETKDGDPRIWFSRLNRLVSPSDILAVVTHKGALYVFNLTQLDLVKLSSVAGSFADFIAPFFVGKLSVVEELRGALSAISAKGFIASVGSADTTVGMLLEAELGIKANSSRAPDFKGIEIKAARAGRANRHNLLAKVPDWSLSNLGSSQALLDEFGYVDSTTGRRQLYCTVQAERPNPQGLYLRVEAKQGLLWESSTRPDLEDVLAWRVSGLEAAISAKHRETFWVKAESVRDGGNESFHFVSAEHTSDPIVEQIVPLIESRHITLDHEVREKNGRAAERGPAFKLRHGGLGLLFPPSKFYPLTN